MRIVERISLRRGVLTLAAFLVPALAFAVPPVVKTVPWIPTDPLVPHDTFPGKSIRLKGTADRQGGTIQYDWDFGDGSAHATGTVGDRYAIEASHVYAGAAGTLFTAKLKVTDTGTGESATTNYLVIMRPQSLSVEVNVAIDEGLWYLHKTMTRNSFGGVDYGQWTGGITGSGYYTNLAANVTAFEVKGHRENGPASNPYTETVARAMHQLFAYLNTTPISNTQTNPAGTFNPDTNGNGYGAKVAQFDELYQGGQFIDAIVASGTPNAVTSTGPVGVGTDPGIFGRTYKAIAQDMLDYYVLCQSDGGLGGSWDYGCNQSQDNSVAQWAAIGLIPAVREFGLTVPAAVKTWNLTWLTNSQNAAGQFGYRSSAPLWGPYATTPSGMVQLALDGKGRGDTRWDKAETMIRDNFNNSGANSSVNIKYYYYGLFSFTKAMLLHDSNGDGIAEPITMLESQTSGVPPIDWYSAEISKGDPTDGVARTIVGHQDPQGYWYGRNTWTSAQFSFETAWAIIMLNRTVTQATPVAVPLANPNPAVAFQTVNFNGSSSYHQDPAKSIIKWEWDLDNNGTYETVGVNASKSFPAVGNYTVWLRVTDNGNPALTNTASLVVVVSLPPLAPTADAGGPYNFCANRQPWFLDGSKSTNPDDGKSEPGKPADKIIAWDWDLDGDGQFDDATGEMPDVTAFFGSLIGQSKLISLRVTDNTAAAFPSSGQPNLTGIDTATVNIRAGTDPACLCVANLTARARNKQVQLVWTKWAGAAKYNIYRSTIDGGPYVKIAETTSAYSTYLNTGLTNGTTYYYIVRPVAANGNEICQSNQAKATPKAL